MLLSVSIDSSVIIQNASQLNTASSSNNCKPPHSASKRQHWLLLSHRRSKQSCASYTNIDQYWQLIIITTLRLSSPAWHYCTFCNYGSGLLTSQCIYLTCFISILIDTYLTPVCHNCKYFLFLLFFSAWS